MSSGVKASLFSRLEIIDSRRASISVRLATWSLIAETSTSSKDPVASFLYRAMKGILAPSSSNWMVLATLSWPMLRSVLIG